MSKHTVTRSTVTEVLRFSMTIVTVISVLFGCASTNLLTDSLPFTGDVSARKDIFVFLDGTGNHAGSETNVWKTYQLVTEC